MGRPRKTLTPDQAAQVEALAAYLSVEQIADYFGMARNTFSAIMKRSTDVSERYARGRARAIGAVATSLIQQARDGNVNAAKFYLETQAGWREVKDHNLNVNLTPDQATAALLSSLGVPDAAEDEG
jgi:IS30 family transposase